MDFGSLSSEGCLDSKKVHFANLLHLCGFYPWVNTEGFYPIQGVHANISI